MRMTTLTTRIVLCITLLINLTACDAWYSTEQHGLLEHSPDLVCVKEQLKSDPLLTLDEASHSDKIKAFSPKSFATNSDLKKFYGTSNTEELPNQTINSDFFRYTVENSDLQLVGNQYLGGIHLKFYTDNHGKQWFSHSHYGQIHVTFMSEDTLLQRGRTVMKHVENNLNKVCGIDFETQKFLEKR